MSRMFKQTVQPRVAAEVFKTDYDARKYLRGVEANPLKYFCPNGAQEQVIQLIVDANKITKIPTLLITFANGSGKTTIAVHIIANLVYGPQNGWFDYPIFRNWPYPKLIWYNSTPDTLKDKFNPEFEKLINPFDVVKTLAEYESSKDSKPYISKYKFLNSDWELTCKSYEQHPKMFESADVGAIFNDEPARDSIRRALKSRRREGCMTAEIMTPLYCEPDTFNDIKQADDRVKAGKKRTMWHITADVYQACRERGIRGHLDAGIIDDMVDEYDEDEREARVEGKAMYFSGMIYRALRREKHLVDPEEYPIDGPGQFMFVADPHESRDTAGIWMFKTPPIGRENPRPRFIVFNEYPEYQGRPFWQMKSQKTAFEEVSKWKQYEREVLKVERSTDIRRVLDRHFGWQKRGEKSMDQLYREAGNRLGWPIVFNPSYTSKGEENEIIYGHKQVRYQLGDLEDGRPGLVIWQHCMHTWNGLGSYIRKHETTKLAEDKAAGEGKIVEKFKDLPDVVRYGVCDAFTATTDRRPLNEQERQSQIVHGKRPPDKAKKTTRYSS